MNKKVVITVEYTLKDMDDYLAGLVAELIKDRNSPSFTDNRSIWDLDPDETIVDVVVS